MAGVRLHMSVVSPPSGTCPPIFPLSSAARSWTGEIDPDPGARNSDREELLWDDLFCNSSRWWDNRPSKASPFLLKQKHQRLAMSLCEFSWWMQPDFNIKLLNFMYRKTGDIRISYIRRLDSPCGWTLKASLRG